MRNKELDYDPNLMYRYNGMYNIKKKYEGVAPLNSLHQYVLDAEKIEPELEISEKFLSSLYVCKDGLFNAHIFGFHIKIVNITKTKNIPLRNAYLKLVKVFSEL